MVDWLPGPQGCQSGAGGDEVGVLDHVSSFVDARCRPGADEAEHALREDLQIEVRPRRAREIGRQRGVGGRVGEVALEAGQPLRQSGHHGGLRLVAGLLDGSGDHIEQLLL